MSPGPRPYLALSLLALPGCPPLPAFVTCEQADACDTTASSEEDGALPTSSDSVHTVTGDGDSTSVAEDSGDETAEPALPPQIVDGVVIPDYIDDNGALDVSVTTEHSDGVRMLLDSGELIELAPVGPGTFAGQILALTGIDNGKHIAVLTPWRGAFEGAPVDAHYVIGLPPPGYEVGWHPDELGGSVVAIAVLPDGRPVELGTYPEMGEPHCYLRLRDRRGAPLEFLDVLPPAYCRAVDLKIDRDTGQMHVLLERKSGDDTVWWAGEISGWGKGPKKIGVGEVGDTAHALAARPDVVAVCGARAVATTDKLDALAVLLRPDQPAETRLFDYRSLRDPKSMHLLGETARDCTFAGDTLVLVGEAHGRHDEGLDKKRDRLTIIESDLAGGIPTWTVAGLDQGVQTRALALDLDDQGRYHIAGDTCLDACEPVGEVRIYMPGGELVDHTSLGPLGSAWFGPHDIAWSPAGYAVVALGEMQGQTFAFKVQAFAPGVPVPLWSFLPNNQQGPQIALAAAIGPYGEVYAGGIGGFVRIGG